MKQHRILLVILIVFSLALLSGCYDPDTYELKMTTPLVDEYVEDFMTAVTQDEYDSFITKYFGEDKIEDYKPDLIIVGEFIEGKMTRYRKVHFDVNKTANSEGSVTATRYIYIIDTDKSTLHFMFSDR